MSLSPQKNPQFLENIKYLGFENDDDLFIVNDPENINHPMAIFHLELAKEFKANAVYMRK